MTRAPVASVAALRETSVLFAALIGVLMLKERFRLQRVLGAGASRRRRDGAAAAPERHAARGPAAGAEPWLRRPEPPDEYLYEMIFPSGSLNQATRMPSPTWMSPSRFSPGRS